jgi:hemerythrin-like domain-containing protein
MPAGFTRTAAGVKDNIRSVRACLKGSECAPLPAGKQRRRRGHTDRYESRGLQGHYAAMTSAVDIIQCEHRSVSAVLHCLDTVLRDIAVRGTTPDFPLLDEMIRYLTSFLFRFHHPKEDLHLFAALRLRCPEGKKVLDELEEEHRQGDVLIEQCRHTLNAYERGGTAGFAAFRTACDAYQDLEATHILKEEREVIPLAKQTLTAEDWLDINTAFTDHNDPLFGKDQRAQFQRLLAAIAQLAPLPHGAEIADRGRSAKNIGNGS